MIANQQVVLHRSRRDLERLHDPRAHEERKNHRDDDGLEVLAEDGFLEGCCHVWFEAHVSGLMMPGLKTRPAVQGTAGRTLRSAVPGPTPVPPSARRGTLPAESRRGRRASCAS